MATKVLLDPSRDRPPSDEMEVEVLRGIEVPKLSPRRRHGELQLAIGAALRDWASGQGRVASEWRFWLSRGSGAEETTLVPDVAYVSTARLLELDGAQAEEPPFAPDVAVEIRSPDDRERNLQTKIRLYLSAGSRLVLDIDPTHRRIVAHSQSSAQVFEAGSSFEHPELPGFSLDVAAFFASADLPSKT